MAIVNKFNVNNKQVTLDADIIENMSANDVSYNSSLQYNKNTVGDKLSELESEVTYLDIQSILIDVTNCEIYKEGYYISNGDVGLLGEERVSSIGVSIVRSLGWKKGQQIIINRIDAGDSSTCAVATYNNGAFVANLISGNGGGGYLPDVPYTFTPDYDFDEIRFSTKSLSTLSVSTYKKDSNRIVDIENRLDEVKEAVKESYVEIEGVSNNLEHFKEYFTGSEIYIPSSPTAVSDVVGPFNAWFGFSNYEDLSQDGFLKGITFRGTLSIDTTFDARISKKVRSENTITGLTTVRTFSFTLPVNESSVTLPLIPFEKDCVLEIYFDYIQSGLIKFTSNPSTTEFVRYKNQSVESGSIWDFNAVFVPFDNGDICVSKKKIKILAIGNSHTEDSFSYVPFIVKECFESIDLTFGILYYGGGSLQLHEQHFDTQDDTSYAYRKIIPSSNKWVTESNGISIQSAIADEDWDIIVFQQNSSNEANYSTFQPYLNSLIRKIQSVVTKPVRFAWLFPYTNSTDLTSSVTMFEQFATNVQRVMNETAVTILFPAATGMQNARTTSLQSLGGGGNMLYTDDHAQEGIPCYCLALPCALVIADLCGLSYEGIYGDRNIPNATWIESHAIPNKNGTSVGATVDNCKISQLCAIMAYKTPLKITDMIELGIVENI